MINWGIIGTGNIAHSFASDFKFSKGGRIKAVASRSKDKAAKFARKFYIETAYDNYRQLYEDDSVDVVYIATPHTMHFSNASDALKCGKAVLCEKPITMNPAELSQLMEISKSADQYLMEAMWTYFLPPIVQAVKWVRKGYIGKLHHVHADFGFRASVQQHSRLFSTQLGGGALLDIGIYLIALCQLVADELPVHISVIAGRSSNDIDLQETIILEYRSGMIANLTASLQCNLPNEATLVGDKGIIRIPEFFKAKEAMFYAGKELVDRYKDRRRSTGYNYEIEAVQRDITNKRRESEIMPLQKSMQIQEIIAQVFNIMKS